MPAIEREARRESAMKREKTETVIYPAVFSYAADGITVTFPDLPGCISCASTPEEAMYMARDALGCWIATAEDMGHAVPAPSAINKIKRTDKDAIIMVDAWLPFYREQHMSGSVKKNVTVPVWLNVLAEKAGLNFSQVLQAGLKASLNIQDK